MDRDTQPSPGVSPSEPDDRWFRQIVETSSDMISRHDAEGAFRYVSPACRRLLGYSPEELLGRCPYEFFHPEDQEAVRHSHRTILDSEVTFTVTYRSRRKDGTYLWLETTSRTVRDPATGEVVEIHASSRDVTERWFLEEALRQSEERFRLACQHAPIGMALVGLDGRWLQVNRALCEIVGYSEAELLEIDFQTITHPDDLDADLSLVRQLLAGEIPEYRMEKRYFHRLGHSVWVLLHGALVRDTAGVPLYFIGQIQDISERKRYEEQLRMANCRLAELVSRDGLTGLYNRRYFDERLQEESERANRSGESLSLVLLDVDGFKSLNDSYGHPAGDEVLKAVAHLVQREARVGDVVARIGGEELAILMPGTPEDAAAAAAERCREAIERFAWPRRPMTASLGVATSPPLSATALHSHADAALYRAKERGRNRVCRASVTVRTAPAAV